MVKVWETYIKKIKEGTITEGEIKSLENGIKQMEETIEILHADIEKLTDFKTNELVVSKAYFTLNKDLIICFYATDEVYLTSLISMDDTYFFKVSNIELQENGQLLVTATETGNWRTKLGRNKTINLRDIYKKPLSIITDDAKISKIQREATYC